MNTFRKLELLTWKYFCYRKYYWIWTVVEILLPILLVYLVVRIGEYAGLFAHSTIQQPVTIEKPINVTNLADSVMYDVIYYTPKNSFTQRHIHRVLISIGRERTSKKNITVKDIQNEQLLVSELSQYDGRGVGIIYLTITKTLEYKIRDPNVWNTSSLLVETESERNGPHLSDPYFNSGFVGLQYFMNTNFMSDNNRRLIVQEALFRAFPYPEYMNPTPFRYLVPIIMAFSIVISSFILLGPLVLAIIREKSSGVNMMMKLSGLQEKYIWISWYIHTLLLGIIIYTCVALLLRFDIRGPNHAVIRYVQPFLLWSIIMLFFIAQLAFCFVFCTIFHSAHLGLTSFCAITISMGYGAVKVKDYHNMVLVHLSCLTPVGAFIQGFQRITYYEILELSVTWQHVFAYELSASDASLGFTLIMLIFDTGLYLFLTYFINSINPGAYGFRKAPNFLFKKKTIDSELEQSGKRKGKTIEEENEEEDKIVANPFIEPTPVSVDVDIVVKNLNKNFGPIHAVKGINFSAYKNEIFVMVGQDNSGKTATLSMMSGLVEPTSGQILYRGTIDMLENMKEFQKILGFCPQKNKLFPYLTIMDHLLFYGMLKGFDKDGAEEEGTHYLQLLGIYENSDDLISDTSDEMQRKLCISVALMGNPEVLVLDEPTVGVDDWSRNRIWSLLKEMKDGRTIIVSTSLMKEADMFGDRIAIMNDGVIMCQGSTEFLHNTFATGYDVRIRKKKADMLESGKKDPTEALIKQMKKAIPGTRVITQTPTELFFNLPADTTKFPSLFKTLEKNKAPLNIDRIAVFCTTLETVYAKIGGDSIYDIDGKPLKMDQYVEEALGASPHVVKKMSGLSLILEQHNALFKKKYILVSRTWFIFIYRVLLPTILMAILIWGTVKFDITDPPLSLSMTSYSDPLVLVTRDSNTNLGFYRHFSYYLLTLTNNVHEEIEEHRSSIYESLLDYGRKNIISYRRKLLLAAALYRPPGADDSRLNYTMLYNKFLRHSLPIAVDTLHNALNTYNERNESHKIITINHPIKSVNVTKEQDMFNIDISDNSPIITVWYVLVGFFTIDLLNFISMAVMAERIDGFKHVQFLSSVSPFTYWINTLVFDFFHFFLIMVARLIIFKAFDEYGFFAFQYDFAIVSGLLILFMISGLLFMYLLSFVLNTRYGGYAVFLIFNLFCTTLTILYYTYQTQLFRIGSIWSGLVLSVVRYVILLIPPLNFNLVLQKFLTAWRVNHIVEAYSRHGLDDTSVNAPGLHYTPYMEFASESNPNGILGEVIFLVADIILYSVLILSIEFGYIGRSTYKILEKVSFRRKSEHEIPIPEDIQKERENVLAATENLSENSNIVLIAKELGKIYRPFLALVSRQRIAVADASFLVRSGECFGIVGPKGSGKTTTLKMLAGEETPTKGDSWILNTKLGTHKTEYFSKAGYCARSDSFLKELTGRETLYLIATVRGVFPKERHSTLEKLVTILGMNSVINEQCSTYNAANRRKICAALALIGDPNAVFLDVPANSIDPHSRRSFYTLLGQVKSTGQAVVLSSNSLQECETICDRFTIMIKGEMKFIGSAEELKVKFAEVFTLLVTVKDEDPDPVQINDSKTNNMMQLKRAIEKKLFKPKSCRLTAETKNSVQYVIQDKLQWSELFQRLEELKKSLKFIKEYQLSERSLEEILASFTDTENQ